MSSESCGYHYYANISQAKIDMMINTLRKYDCTVSGSNPWSVTTNRLSIELQGIWDVINQVLYIIVVDKDSFVPCGKIWEALDPAIDHISDLSDSEVNS